MVSAKVLESPDKSTYGYLSTDKSLNRKEIAMVYGISTKTLSRFLIRWYGDEYKGVRLFLPKDLKKIKEKFEGIT